VIHRAVRNLRGSRYQGIFDYELSNEGYLINRRVGDSPKADGRLLLFIGRYA
jgi:hypothetical protein